MGRCRWWRAAPSAGLVLGALVVGCGGSSYAYPQESRGYGGGYAESAPAAPSSVREEAEAGSYESVRVAATADSSGGGGDWDADYHFSGAEVTGQAAERPRMAQAQPQQAQQGGGQGGRGQPPQQQATDATRAGPLLIYTAQITLAVYEVTQTQDRLIESLRGLDGFLTQRTDQQIVLRVPAARFEQALRLVEEGGDVLHRNVQAQDVGEEFRDLAIRIRNHEAMRDRLEALLARASDVQGALAIERELQRITGELETMKGRQRYLADQIAFSTITVYFQPLSTEPTRTDGFLLPFPWLNELGLSTLMRL